MAGMEEDQNQNDGLMQFLGLGKKTLPPLTSPNSTDERLKAAGVQGLQKTSDPGFDMVANREQDSSLGLIDKSRQDAIDKQKAEEAVKPNPVEVVPGSGITYDQNPNNQPVKSEDVLNTFIKQADALDNRSSYNINKIYDENKAKLDEHRQETRAIISALAEGKFVNDLTPLLFFTKNGDEAARFIQNASASSAGKEKALIDLKMGLINEKKDLEQARTKALVQQQRDESNDIFKEMLANSKDKTNLAVMDKNIRSAQGSFIKSNQKEWDSFNAGEKLTDALDSTMKDYKAGEPINPYLKQVTRVLFDKGVLGEVGKLNVADEMGVEGSKAAIDKLQRYINKQTDGSDITPNDIRKMQQFLAANQYHTGKKIAEKADATKEEYLGTFGSRADPTAAEHMFSLRPHLGSDFDVNALKSRADNKYKIYPNESRNPIKPLTDRAFGSDGVAPSSSEDIKNRMLQRQKVLDGN